MKNKHLRFAALPLIALPLLLSGCLNAFQPVKASTGTGLVQISLAPPAVSNVMTRTAMPLASSLYYTLTFTAGTTIEVNLDQQLATVVSLEPGAWNLVVEGYPDIDRESPCIAEGNITVYVEENKTTEYTVELDYAEVSLGGTGTISYRIQFPGDITFGTLRIKKYDALGNEEGTYKTIDLLQSDYDATTRPDGNTYNAGIAYGTLDNVPGGYYQALIKLYNEVNSASAYAAHTELVHVYDKSTTPVYRVFGDNNFSAADLGFRYVKAGETGTGFSSDDPSGDLQKMIDDLAALRASSSGYTGIYVVKVAGGTYTPQWLPMIPPPADPNAYTAGDRDSAFILRDGVEVWGGYDFATGNRDSQQITTLSGDIGEDSDTTNDAYHVVLAVNIPADSDTVLDGLTITGGNASPTANPTDPTTVGGVSIYKTYGGGMYNNQSSPTLNNVVISNNSVDGKGGGMYNNQSSPVLVNVVVSGNKAAGPGGGISNVNNSSPVLTNALISGNRAGDEGGGMDNNGGSPVLTNVTIAGNYAEDGGGGIYSWSGNESKIRNSIIWGNVAGITPTILPSGIEGAGTPVISHSIVESYGTGGTVLDVDPKFIAWEDPSGVGWGATTGGNYRLDSSSPVINAGSDSYYATGSTPNLSYISTDLDNSARVKGAIDMGAYESGSVATPSTTRYVTGTGSGSGTGDWSAASNDLQKMMDELWVLCALHLNSGYTGDYIVKVGAGTYTPQYKPNFDATTDYATVTTPTNRNVTFILREGVKVRGGYIAAGEEIDESTRKSRFGPDGSVSNANYKAILSGDIGVANSEGDNAYHVVLAVNIPANSGTVLDGFTITGGNADGSDRLVIEDVLDIMQTDGGGIYNTKASPTLNNVTISQNKANNYAGGMYSYTASPTLNNVTISNNSVGSGSYGDGGGMYNCDGIPTLNNVTITSNTSINGGGMDNFGVSPVLINVKISGNTATNEGGGMRNCNSSPVLVNVEISGNVATVDGGGIYNNGSNGSSPVLTNVTIAGNYAGTDGGGIYNYDGNSNPQIRNSIIWGNLAGTLTSSIDGSGTPIINYSIVDGYAPSGTVQNVNPSFVSLAAAAANFPQTVGNYRLDPNPSSPAINAGDNDYYPNGAGGIAELLGVSLDAFSTETRVAINEALETDLTYITSRKDDNNIDMGAYEYIESN